MRQEGQPVGADKPKSAARQRVTKQVTYFSRDGFAYRAWVGPKSYVSQKFGGQASRRGLRSH